MLKIENRLKKKKEFDRVFRFSRPIYSQNFAIRFIKRTNADFPTRFGFVISNKIDKRSTKRNALKRQLREIVRGLISCFQSGYDVVVVVKQNFNFPYNHEEIKNQLEELFAKTNLLRKGE